VYIKIILTIFGVSFGLSCSIIAATPETTGAAIELPLRYIKRLSLVSVTPASSSGCAMTRLLPAAD